MKEKIEKAGKYIRKYLPDILFLAGVGIASYNLLRPPKRIAAPWEFELPSLTEYFTTYKVIGILLVALAIDIAIRRYFIKK